MEDYDKEDIKNKFREYLEDEGLTSKLLKIADNYPDERSLLIDYNDLTLYFGMEFPEYILDNPKTCLDEGKNAIDEILGSSYEDVEIEVRIEELPAPRTKQIRHLRAEDLTNFLGLEGLVRKATEVRPKVAKAIFRCKRCGANTMVSQGGGKLDRPLECAGCGKSSNKTSFNLLIEESEFRDYQTLEIQESPEDLRGGEQPERIKGWVKKDLVGKVSPGDRITLNGILEGDPKSSSGGSESRVFDIYMKVNSIEVKEYEYQDIQLSDEDKEKIEEMSNDPRLFSKIVKSIAPSIQGMDEIKKGLALQLFGGIRKTTPDENKIRGDIHVLLVGDPGTAKSQLLRYISDLSPRSMYASGKGSTGAGLTAAAVREEIMGESQWTLEAGTLVLADRGIATIDELDKMKADDRSAMHEAMEQQSIHVAKAGINAKLNSRCAVLGAANPEMGRFQKHNTISSQINLPSPLISRFDLIFPIMDEPDEEEDRGIAQHILGVHQDSEKMKVDETYEPADTYTPPLEQEFFRKYVSYAKTMNPIMTEEAREALEKFYIQIRSSGEDEGSIPITARQLESLIRLAEASARIYLRKRVAKKDAQRAISVTNYFLNEVISTEEGRLDIDYMTSDFSQSDRTLVQKIQDILKDRQDLHEEGVPLEEIVEKAEGEGVSESETKKELEKMRRNGQVMEPSSEKYKLV